MKNALNTQPIFYLSESQVFSRLECLNWENKCGIWQICMSEWVGITDIEILSWWDFTFFSYFSVLDGVRFLKISGAGWLDQLIMHHHAVGKLYRVSMPRLCHHLGIDFHSATDTKHLLCARNWLRFWRYHSQQNKDPALMEYTLQWFVQNMLGYTT